MNNLRKAIGIVVTGAVAVAVVKSGQQIAGRYRRQRQIRTLRSWYDEWMNKIAEHANLGVDRYMKQLEMRSTEETKESVGYTTADWSQGLVRRTVREAIIAHESAQLTKRYHERLYDLGAKDAYKFKQMTEVFMKSAKRLRETLDKAGYPVDILSTDLHVDLPA